MTRSYRRLTFVVPAAGEERLVAELWARGTLGVETLTGVGDSIRLEAYFDAGAAGGLEATTLSPGARLEAVDQVADRDWLAEHRRLVRPLAVGSRLWIDPREPGAPDGPPPPDRRLLRLPARTAFGTGSHESTRLAVELLETADLDGKRVLDVGAGSGILAFAALCFGARFVLGVEIDPAAVLVASENRGLNRLRPALVAGTVDCLSGRVPFDLALVNVRPRRIAADLPWLARMLAPGAAAIFSGFLASSRAGYEEQLSKLGFRRIHVRGIGEWSALLAEWRGADDRVRERDA